MMLSLVTVLANFANIPTLFILSSSGTSFRSAAFLYTIFVLNIKEKLIMFHKV